MIALRSKTESPAFSTRLRSYRIYLNISPADREDAWEMCRVALHYGGVEVSDCCFAFANQDRWMMALESLRFRFGPKFFEAVDSTETPLE